MKLNINNNLLKIILSNILLFSLLSSCIQEDGGSNQISIIPEPRSIVYTKGSFTFSPTTKIITKSDDSRVQATGIFLKESLKDIYKPETAGADSDNGESSILIIDNGGEKTQGQENYELIVTQNEITITGSSAGLFYGIQSLLQMIPLEPSTTNQFVIPCCEIKDEPRFSWRGMHLDVSRHFFGPDVIKRYLDLMAMYKLNVFHWHLTDDQGWRIQIDKYPLLTEVGAWREGTGTEPWSYFVNKAAMEGKPKYGGFYTKDEIRDIIEYANDRYITIIPEIELPGHSWAPLLAYPELSCTGVPWQKPDDVPFEFSDPFCAGNEKTFEFFTGVLGEVIDLFPSEYIHIGGDECKKTPWEVCEKCQKRMETEGLENVEELQSYFIKRIEKIVLEKGRKIIGWNEILEGGLAPEATVMSWQGEAGGIVAAKEGHNVVMTPGSNLYFNRDQFDNGITGKGMILSLDLVYNYEPVPKELNEEESKHILGAQGCLWSEFLYSEEILINQLMPRMTAMSELTWTTAEKKNWSAYLEKLEQHFLRLDKMNIGYAVPPPSGLGDEIFVGKEFIIELDKMYKSSDIYYTLDGREPDRNSLKYDKAFYVTDSALIKAKLFMPSGRSGPLAIGNYSKVVLREAATTTEELVSGLNYTLLIGEITSLKDFSELVASESATIAGFNIPEAVPADFYGLEFNGLIDIPVDGIYTFYSSSDDGSQLFLNESLLVDNDGVHGMGFKNGKAALAKGKHVIRVIFFDNRYGEGLVVEMEGPEMKRQQIPDSLLFRKIN